VVINACRLLCDRVEFKFENISLPYCILPPVYCVSVEAGRPQPLEPHSLRKKTREKLERSVGSSVFVDGTAPRDQIRSVPEFPYGDDNNVW
jgi:hypothetical protein